MSGPSLTIFKQLKNSKKMTLVEMFTCKNEKCVNVHCQLAS